MNSIILEDIESIISSNCVDWDKFRDKAVMISGASGMLPSYMALTILRLNVNRGLNCKLIALVRNKKKAEIVFKDFISDKNFELILQDVCTPICYDGAVDFIIHAASQASPKYYGTDPVGTLNANIIGTHNLLEFAKRKKAKSFLFFSTGGVYGSHINEEEEIKEDIYGVVDPLNVRNCYFESKRMAENMCICYAYQFGIPAKIVRIFHTLGPHLDINDGRAFSDFCKAIIEGKNIVLRSDGSAYRNFCYVSDAVKAYFMVLLDGKDGEAYNVGSHDNEISMKDLANLLVESYPEKGLSVEYQIEPDKISKMRNPKSHGIPNIDKIKSLGWREDYNTREIFTRTISGIELTAAKK